MAGIFFLFLVRLSSLCKVPLISKHCGGEASWWRPWGSYIPPRDNPSSPATDWTTRPNMLSFHNRGRGR